MRPELLEAVLSGTAEGQAASGRDGTEGDVPMLQYALHFEADNVLTSQAVPILTSWSWYSDHPLTVVLRRIRQTEFGPGRKSGYP